MLDAVSWAEFGRNDTVPRQRATALAKHPLLKVDLFCKFQSAMTSSIKVSVGQLQTLAVLRHDALPALVSSSKERTSTER